MTADEIISLPFVELLRLVGLTQTQCSRRWHIPLRTVQRWKAGDRKCPGYVKFLIAEAAGLTKEEGGDS